jgi:hypothetical protein
MDHHVHGGITQGLRVRGVDVLTADEDNASQLPDPDLLDRATALGRVLFSQDTDLLREGARRQQAGEHFAGLIYAHQLHAPIGRCIDDLELLAKACDPPEFINRVEYLPLK